MLNKVVCVDKTFFPYSQAEVYTFGACVTSWKLPNGKDLLFVRPDAVFNGQKPIRYVCMDSVCSIFISSFNLSSPEELTGIKFMCIWVIISNLDIFCTLTNIQNRL